MTTNSEKKYSYIFNTIKNDMTNFNIPITDLIIKGSKIMEYGSGSGEATIRISDEFPDSHIYGVDVNDAYINVERRLYEFRKFREISNVVFLNISNGQSNNIPINKADRNTINLNIIPRDTFKFIYSWCVFEHIDKTILFDTLVQIRYSLTDDGIFYIKINPLYFSSRGSHLSHIIELPYAHLIYNDEFLKSLVYENDKTNRTDDVWYQYKTLNKITGDELKLLCNKAGLQIIAENRKYEGKPCKELLFAYQKEALTNKEITLLLAKKHKL